jgi:large conductance mechanosensitive channel
MLSEFKAFIMRGNVLELAVAVIIAAAFGAVVTSFTNNVLMPPIGLALGGVDFTALEMVLQPAVLNDTGEVVTEAVTIGYGIFIQRVIDFLIIAFVVFMLVRTYNKTKKKREEAPGVPAGPSSEELLAEIRDLLKARS